ncbi:tripeptidyl-peptidase I [Trichoderma asperellum]|nr:peptidase S8/S53 domain-containing protein [Trichoderma asperelloides]
MAKLSALRLVSLLCFAVVQTSAAVLVESINQVPHGWKSASIPHPSSSIVLQIALVQQNIHELEWRLAAVSTPDSPDYGKYLDIKEINEIFAPSNVTYTAVESWLKSHGVASYTRQGGSIWFQTTVSIANAMLTTEFKTYSDSTGTEKLRTLQYSIPEELVGHVDLISPTTYFGTTKAMRALRSQNVASVARAKYLNNPQKPSGCNQTIIHKNETYQIFHPDCLRAKYGVDGYTPSAKSGSRIGFSSFLNETSSFSDLALYEKHYGLPKQNISVFLINGATDVQPPSNKNDSEANLDVQTIVSFTHPLPVTEFVVAGIPPYIPDPALPIGDPVQNEPWLEFYEFLMSKTNEELPQVITNSYGDEEQTVPEPYAVRVCNQIGLMGLRGISILASSGDTGVGMSCVASNSTTPQFNPMFPASCPYLTTVGGTQHLDHEIAWKLSSGGFSNYFPRPWYQEEAVRTYLERYVSTETKAYYGRFANFLGRGFPDVAALSLNPDYPVIIGGELGPNGGTSASAPVVASIIALLNDARLCKGKPALGFLNPLIYQYAYKGGFRDITSGQSSGCGGNNSQTGPPPPGAGFIPGAHWNATKGWDPTTGFGVPNFKKLLSLAQSI